MIIENTTGLEINEYENSFTKRVYINKKVGILAHDLYFDFESEKVHFKATKKTLSERAGWEVDKLENGYKVFSSRLVNKYFIVV